MSCGEFHFNFECCYCTRHRRRESVDPNKQFEGFFNLHFLYLGKKKLNNKVQSSVPTKICAKTTKNSSSSKNLKL